MMEITNIPSFRNIVLISTFFILPLFSNAQNTNVEFNKKSFLKEDFPRLKEALAELDKGDKLFEMDQ